MKRTIIFSLLAILLIPFLVMGCGKTNAVSEVPDKEIKTIEVSIDEFSAVNDITRNIDMKYPGTLTVTLGSNPTTGYQWSENPVPVTAGKDPIVFQQSHEFIAPEQKGEDVLLGAPGKDVWVFESLSRGSTAILFSYGQPWEGGEKDAWTVALNVTIR